MSDIFERHVINAEGSVYHEESELLERIVALLDRLGIVRDQVLYTGYGEQPDTKEQRVSTYALTQDEWQMGIKFYISGAGHDSVLRYAIARAEEYGGVPTISVYDARLLVSDDLEANYKPVDPLQSIGDAELLRLDVSAWAEGL
jgi:hypothetical protein